MPTVKPDNHAPFVEAVEEFGGVPVLAHRGGHYPSLLADDGSKVETLIEVARFGDRWHVVAVAGRGRDGRRRVVPVGGRPTLEEARDLYPDALAAVGDAPRLHAEADRLAAALAIGNQPRLSRPDYEALAAQWGFDPGPDNELSRWGDYDYPQYPLADLPRRWINQRRGFGIAAEREAAEQARRAQAGAGAAALRRGLRRLPAARTETMFVRVGSPDEWLQGGALHTVTRRGAPRRITGDDPSVLGSHLLGHEGEMGQAVTVEVRCAAGRERGS